MRRLDNWWLAAAWETQNYEPTSRNQGWTCWALGASLLGISRLQVRIHLRLFPWQSGVSGRTLGWRPQCWYVCQAVRQVTKYTLGPDEMVVFGTERTEDDEDNREQWAGGHDDRSRHVSNGIMRHFTDYVGSFHILGPKWSIKGPETNPAENKECLYVSMQYWNLFSRANDFLSSMLHWCNQMCWPMNMTHQQASTAYLYNLSDFQSYHLVYVDESGYYKRVRFRRTG